MTTLQKNIREFMILAEQQVREKPSLISKEEAELRVKLIFEEAFELADAFGVMILRSCQPISPQKVSVYFSELNFNILDHYAAPQNLVEAADAIADLNYVVNGTAVAMGLDMEPIDAEVHRSNMTKFKEDCNLNADGKIIKGPSYSPANLQPIIEEQLK